MLDKIAVLGLFMTGVIILCYKWGFVDWYEFRKPLWAPGFCGFCITFWVSLAYFCDFGFHSFVYALATASLQRFFFNSNLT